MNKKNLIIIVLILIAVSLITGGIVWTVPSSKTPDTKPVENRNYKTIVMVAENTVNQVSATDDGFGKIAKDSGFSTATCSENSCLAENSGYTNSEQKDMIRYVYDPANPQDSHFNVTLFFYKDDYTASNIATKLNAITNNYYGYKLTEKQISEVMNGLSSGSEYYIKTHNIGDYTIELNFAPMKNEELYVVKYWFVSTNIYNEYISIQRS